MPKLILDDCFQWNNSQVPSNYTTHPGYPRYTGVELRYNLGIQFFPAGLYQLWWSARLSDLESLRYTGTLRDSVVESVNYDYSEYDFLKGYASSLFKFTDAENGVALYPYGYMTLKSTVLSQSIKCDGDVREFYYGGDTIPGFQITTRTSFAVYFQGSESVIDENTTSYSICGNTTQFFRDNYALDHATTPKNGFNIPCELARITDPMPTSLLFFYEDNDFHIQHAAHVSGYDVFYKSDSISFRDNSRDQENNLIETIGQAVLYLRIASLKVS